jgi:hypothetical protein
VDKLIELLELVEYICKHKHKGGAYIALPEAVHTRECPFWRVGKKHGPCVCGGVELQEEIDLVFGYYK